MPLSAGATAASATGQVTCPAGTLVNRKEEFGQAFQEALREACQTFESAEFRQRVESSALAAQCPPFLGEHKLLPGTAVYRMLAEGLPADFTLSIEPVGGRKTNAATNTRTHAMRIEAWEFDGWKSGDKTKRAVLVNTLVHEMSHLVPEKAGSGSALFQDPWKPWCKRRKLVSYNLGDFAEELWLARQS